MSSLSSRGLASAVLASMLAACQWTIADHTADEHRGEGSAASAPPCGLAGQSCATSSKPSSCGVKVDRWKELLVIHQSVLLDRRARNDVDDAPWSFRHLFERLAGSETNAATFIRAWLSQWKTVTAVGPDRAPVPPRPAVGTVLLDPWNASSGGSLATAPFRLIAIVHRPDLRAEADGCSGRGGEVRFVYTAVDPSTRAAIPMTVIVEVPYPTTRSARGWIGAWHALGTLPFGNDYNEALAVITSDIVAASAPETWLVRTNELAFGEPEGLPWEMREFALASQANGTYETSGSNEANGSAMPRLVQIPIATTPRIELDRSASLDSWVTENKARVRDGSYVLPGGLQAGAAPIPRSFFQWSSQTLEPTLLTAFSHATCNGCHGGERSGETSLPFQHIAAADQRTEYYGPNAGGETRLSSWLNDPSGRDDELTRRETSMAQALCGTCTTTPTSPLPGSHYGE
jgi:hypothetical protein